ncbi:hypothetical protein, conserved [Plasmodium ovale]|uniref:Uncharacterized protein n=1 Tax=Plasmodium ovale TaxID=36330 RepID=A0A1C3KIN2_PLAOA|nr:hypothetical protein, conserved [Plasmodium ovale]
MERAKEFLQNNDFTYLKNLLPKRGTCGCTSFSKNEKEKTKEEEEEEEEE